MIPGVEPKWSSSPLPLDIVSPRPRSLLLCCEETRAAVAAVDVAVAEGEATGEGADNNGARESST